MGRLGKDSSPVLWIGHSVLLLVLAACAGSDRDGRYAGTVTTEAGLCGLVSPTKPAVGTLLIRGGEVVFTPEEGVITLGGRIDGAGHVIASTTTVGIDHKPFLMAFEGDLRGGHVEGKYATPRCRAVVRLDRVG